jgi:DNA-binding LytR/AlgR family response regulator
LCNKCYLVNLAFVEEVQGSTVVVAGEEISVSRPKKKAFMEALAAYHNH